MMCFTAPVKSVLHDAGDGDERRAKAERERKRKGRRRCRDGRSAKLRTTFDALCSVENGLLEGCEGVSAMAGDDAIQHVID